MLTAVACLASADMLTFDYNTYFHGSPGSGMGDKAKDACITSNGSLVVVGTTVRTNPLDPPPTVEILIYPIAATTPIVRTYTPDFGGRVNSWVHSCAADTFGNFYVIVSYGYDASHLHYSVEKFDQNGQFLWTREFASLVLGAGDKASVKVDASGNALIAYTMQPSTLDNLAVNIVKYDPNGNILWDNIINDSPGTDQLLQWELDESGNPFALTLSEVAHTGVYDYVLTRFSSTGPKEWIRALGVTGVVSSPTGLTTLEDGSAIVMGIHDTTGTSGNLYMSRFSPVDGSVMWEDWYHDDLNPMIPGAMSKDLSGNIYITGSYIPFGGNAHSQLYLRKVAQDGSRLWLQSVSYSNVSTLGVGLAVDSGGFAHTIGSFGTGTNDLTNSQDFDFTFDGVSNIVRTAGNWNATSVVPVKVITDGTHIYTIGSITNANSLTGEDIYINRAFTLAP